MTIGSEMPYRRKKREDGRHTGSLVLDQHRKAATGQAEAEDGPACDKARKKPH